MAHGLAVEDLEFRSDGTIKAIIRRSKADPFGMGRIAFTSRRTATEVERWLDWRGWKLPRRALEPTDLPAAAQTKLSDRYQAREALGGLAHLVDEDDVGLI